MIYAIGGSGIDLDLPAGAALTRRHLYEGYTAEQATDAIRANVRPGDTVILTNAAGSINPAWKVGTLVGISDHINLTGQSPLIGADFVDLSHVYEKVDGLPQGVYAQVAGPHYETPAEIRMLRTMGADLVGMSTAIEAIAARACGAKVYAISVVTDLAAGLQESISHAEVVAAARLATPKLQKVIAKLLKG